MDFATRAVKPLVHSARYDGWPAWTPSGDQLVFATNRRGAPEIWSKSLREGWERPLLTPADFDDPSTWLLAEAAVSPDGRSLAVQRYGATGIKLFMTPFSGGKPIELAAGEADRKDSPAWSPDAGWVAFVTRNEIRKVRAGSRDPSVLVRSDLGSTAVVAGGGYSARTVHWSRRGQILYNSKEGLTLTDETGAEAKVVTKEISLVWDWSADGKLIYAIREIAGRQMELVTIDPGSGELRTVAPLGRYPVSPAPTGYGNPIRQLAVAPDGKSAVFAYLQPNSQIWMMEQVK